MWRALATCNSDMNYWKLWWFSVTILRTCQRKDKKNLYRSTVYWIKSKTAARKYINCSERRGNHWCSIWRKNSPRTLPSPEAVQTEMELITAIYSSFPCLILLYCTIISTQQPFSLQHEFISQKFTAAIKKITGLRTCISGNAWIIFSHLAAVKFIYCQRMRPHSS